MKRMLGNLSRTVLYLATAGLIGYIQFDQSGLSGVFFGTVFFILGVLLVATWQKKPESELQKPKPIKKKKDDNTISVSYPPEVEDKVILEDSNETEKVDQEVVPQSDNESR